MRNNPDYYVILGVDRGVDQDTIKKAYRKLAMQFHPDKNPGNKDAEEKFKEAAMAYEVLGNPEKRAKYDRFGAAAFQQGMGGQGFHDVEDIFSSFSDIFSDFFGGPRQQRRSRTGPARGSDLRYICEIALKDVVQGLEKDIEFDTTESCATCEGSGAEKGTQAENCNTCGGSGQVVRAQGFFSVAAPCPSCGGNGKIIRRPCGSCKGRARTAVHRKIRVTIPAGVDTGTQLRVTGEGEGGMRGGPAGDLYVEIHVREDERFSRHGVDLLGQVEISYTQALLGAEVQVETLDGRESITVEPGTNTGERIRVNKKGLPSLRNSARGDLYFEVDVQFPKKLKKEEEKMLREIAKLRGENVTKKGLF